MTETRFQSATVLLYDPEPSMRQNTRSALLNIGFGEVIACADGREFVERAERGDFDLIVAETAGEKADIHHVIRDIRRHRLGKDPFINVVLSLWNTAPDIVGDVMNAGADDLITRPMSRTQISTRILRLISARKPFIVTADYIGPDRRLVTRSSPTKPMLIVPNSLRAKVENRPELAATPEAVRLAMTVVNERKISIYAEQLMRLSSAVILLSGSRDSFGDRADVVVAMRERNKSLIESVAGTEFTHIVSLCDALESLLLRIEKATTKLDDKDRDLLSQIPYAIHKGCSELHLSAGLAFDIREISNRVRDTQKNSGAESGAENAKNSALFA
ncbi:response regulator [Sneathiella chungangensis]|uniref:Response regulator n=1 Tax=Sneathiella chungangensis TaxID=1418234 RepID=A0A845MI56_9PROT|nr:response regulator [Sneathiella chungangensis]MZR23648.1 response regulator [Sneathiella chungangensis]